MATSMGNPVRFLRIEFFARLRPLLLVSALGAVTTVCVAWGCEIRRGPSRTQRHPGLADDVNRTLRLAHPLPRASANHGWWVASGGGTLRADPHYLYPFNCSEPADEM